MSANKVIINRYFSKYYCYNRSEIITFNIENIMLFVYIINTIADLFYICKASLLASLVTIVVHSFKATFLLGYVSVYYFIAYYLNIFT